MATLSRIAVHPVAALDPVACDEMGFTGDGRLRADRMLTLVDESGERLDRAETAAVHPLRALVDLDGNRVTLRVDELALQGGVAIPGEPPGPDSFHLDDDREALERWLSTYFGRTVRLESAAEAGGGSDAAGPALVARATLREVGSWYGLTAAEVRMRVRPNLVVGGVPAFWEDRLVADGGRQVRVGPVTLEGERRLPCSEVSARDPYTGERLSGFRETFVEQREETLPEWAEPTFDGEFYRLTVQMAVPGGERDATLCVGDSVELLEGSA